MENSEQPIVPKELKERIEKELMDIELDFVIRQHKVIGGDIVDALKKYSPLLSGIDADRAKLREHSIRMIPIDKHWKKNVILMLLDYHKADIRAEEKKEPEHLGMFVYNIENKEDGKAHKLLGIPDGEQLLEVHVPVRAVEKAKGSAAGLMESMAEIARFIVTERPEISSIVGRSWLMSRPEAEMLGFEKVDAAGDEDGEDSRYHSHGWWLQLIDKNGKIRPERKKQLLEEGTLPFDYAYGKIDAVELLKRFLPAEMRGEITLKKLDQGKWAEFKEFIRETKELKEIYKTAPPELLEKSMNEQMPVFRAKIGEDLFTRFVKVVLDARASGQVLRWLNDDELELAKSIETIQNKMEADCYVPFKVLIE